MNAKYTEKLDEHDDYLSKLEETLELLNREINKEIFTAVRRATIHLSKSLPIGQRLHEKEDPSSREEPIKSIVMMLSNKANKSDLEKLHDLKS